MTGLQALHEVRDIGQGCFDQQMEVIAHQAVHVQADAVPIDTLEQTAQKPLPVTLIAEDALAAIAAHKDVVDRSSECDARFPCHSLTLRGRSHEINAI